MIELIGDWEEMSSPILIIIRLRSPRIDRRRPTIACAVDDSRLVGTHPVIRRSPSGLTSFRNALLCSGTVPRALSALMRAAHAPPCVQRRHVDTYVDAAGAAPNTNDQTRRARATDFASDRRSIADHRAAPSPTVCSL